MLLANKSVAKLKILRSIFTLYFRNPFFNLDYKLYSQRSYAVPIVDKGYRKTIDDCASLCRGSYPFFTYGRAGSSSCHAHLGGCICMCGSRQIKNGGSPTYNLYKFDAGTSHCHFIIFETSKL